MKPLPVFAGFTSRFTLNTVLLLLPDFSLILLGMLIRRWMTFGENFWAGLEKLVYFILFPALLINSLVKAKLDLLSAFPLLATAFVAIVAGMLLGLLPRWFSKVPALTFASMYQCAFRYNSYIGLAVVSMLFGQSGVATLGIIIGTAVPLVNVVAIGMLARHGQLGLWREVLRNPLIWATIIGLSLNLVGHVPPAPVLAFLGRLAEASIALGLLAVGAALKMGGASGVKGLAAWLIVVKLLFLPLVAAFVGPLLGLSGLYYQVAVLFAALPTASSAYILAVRMGGDGKSVAWLISASTLVSMLTLTLWAAWLTG